MGLVSWHKPTHMLRYIVLLFRFPCRCCSRYFWWLWRLWSMHRLRHRCSPCCAGFRGLSLYPGFCLACLLPLFLDVLKHPRRMCIGGCGSWYHGIVICLAPQILANFCNAHCRALCPFLYISPYIVQCALAPRLWPIPEPLGLFPIGAFYRLYGIGAF